MPRKPKTDGIHYNDPFPTALRKLMWESGITQEELKTVLGVTSRQSVTGYTDGNTAPTADKIIALAKFFNVSADYLLGLSVFPSTNEDVKTVNKVTGLSVKAVENISVLKMSVENGPEDSFGPFSEMLSTILEDDDLGCMIADIVSFKDELKMLTGIAEEIRDKSSEFNLEDRCAGLFSDARLLKYEIIEAYTDLLDRAVPSESVLKDVKAILFKLGYTVPRERKKEE